MNKPVQLPEVVYKVTFVKWPDQFVGFLFRLLYQCLNLLIMIEITNFPKLKNINFT